VNVIALTVAIVATGGVLATLILWRRDPVIRRLREINRELDPDYDDRLLAVLFGRWWRSR
jgi:hypothetical protein